MLKWEKTKHAATIGILGGCGLGVLITGLLLGQGIRAAEWMVVICFMSLALVEAFSFRARKKPTARRRSTKKYQGAKPPALDEAPEGFYPEGDHTEISEGIVKKGGVNKKPTTPRPAAPKGQGGAVAEAEGCGHSTTIQGRRRPIAAINSRNRTEKQAAERVAVNTPIQGSAADIVKLAMIRVDAAFRAGPPGAKLLLQVHDELIAEAPEAEAPAVAALMKREMEAAIELSLPLRADVEVARRWGDMH